MLPAPRASLPLPPPPRAGHKLFAELVTHLLAFLVPGKAPAALFEGVAARSAAQRWWWHHGHGSGHGHGHGGGGGGEDGSGGEDGEGGGEAGKERAGRHSHYRWRFENGPQAARAAAGEPSAAPGAAAGGASEHHAAGGAAAGLVAPWLPPPLIPGNDEEKFGQSCFFGADLKLAGRKMEARIADADAPHTHSARSGQRAALCAGGGVHTCCRRSRGERARVSGAQAGERELGRFGYRKLLAPETRFSVCFALPSL